MPPQQKQKAKTEKAKTGDCVADKKKRNPKKTHYCRFNDSAPTLNNGKAASTNAAPQFRGATHPCQRTNSSS
ncbi:hypothetical protein PSAB6_250098 [Paraburkholderia sabiae]|nr:hypothetical protein PSAB6_250098 [Paraburkholderia sabiae]